MSDSPKTNGNAYNLPRQPDNSDVDNRSQPNNTDDDNHSRQSDNSASYHVSPSPDNQLDLEYDHTFSYATTMGDSRVSASPPATEIGSPTETASVFSTDINTGSTSLMANISLALLAYRFDHSLLEHGQHRLEHAYDIDEAERARTKQYLLSQFSEMVMSAKRLLVEHCKCPECGEYPLRHGSRHEKLLGETKRLWDEMEKVIDAIELNIHRCDASDLNILKPLFEDVEASLMKDIAACGEDA